MRFHYSSIFLLISLCAFQVMGAPLVGADVEVSTAKKIGQKLSAAVKSDNQLLAYYKTNGGKNPTIRKAVQKIAQGSTDNAGYAQHLIASQATKDATAVRDVLQNGEAAAKDSLTQYKAILQDPTHPSNPKVKAFNEVVTKKAGASTDSWATVHAVTTDGSDPLRDAALDAVKIGRQAATS